MEKRNPALGVELFDRMNQAEVAFLDQVEQGKAAIDVVLGNIHNQPQVVLDHLLTRFELACSCPARVMQFLFDTQKLVMSDVIEYSCVTSVERSALAYPSSGELHTASAEAGFLGLLRPDPPHSRSS